MKAIILAAGVGSRLHPITKEKPKTLVCINGKPILGHILDALLQNGIHDVIICTGFKANLVIEYCRSFFPDMRFIFIQNDDYANTNNMYSFYLAKCHLNEDFLLMNADVVFDPRIISGLSKKSGSFIAVEKGSYNEESMKISIDSSHRITGISKILPKKEAYGCSIDIYRIAKEDIPVLIAEMEMIISKRGDRNQWTEVLLDNLFKSNHLKAYPFDVNPCPWAEIDDFQDLASAEVLFNHRIRELNNKKVFFIDRDGTLILDNHVIDGANELLDLLRERGKKLFLLSNNSSKSPSTHIESLRQAGLKLEPHELLISLDASLDFLLEKDYKRIFWVATSDVSSYISSKGFSFETVSPQALLLTYDTEITYSKISHFIRLLRNSIPYIATHRDLLYPTKDGALPDIGCTIDIIAKSTGKLPDKIFGKPSLEMIIPTLKRLNVPLSQAVIVGDRLYTDIKLAAGSDLLSVLVLTGETKRSNYEFSDIRADIVLPSIKELFELLSR